MQLLIIIKVVFYFVFRRI